MDGSKEKVVAGLQYLKLQARGHRWLQFFIEFVDAGINFGGIGTRSLEHHVDGAWLSIDIGGEIVAHSTYLHIGNVTQVQQVTTIAGAQHYIIKLLHGLERAFILH